MFSLWDRSQDIAIARPTIGTELRPLSTKLCKLMLSHSPERNILSMITDINQQIRILGWRKIKKARHVSEKKSCLHEFLLPKVRLESEKYRNTIDWFTFVITEHPLKNCTNWEQLRNNKRNSDVGDGNISCLSCYNQQVEIVIKFVSKGSSSAFGIDEWN